MKLRNKKTGEIDDYIFEVITDRIDLYRRVGHSDTKNIWHYNSLAELNEEWEDMPEEEPKEYWYIDYDGGILCGEADESSAEKMMISMGNYFESLEEAEKAVEKLKAFKRLKDKGFRFCGFDEEAQTIQCMYPDDSISCADELFHKDLDLLFSQEDD